MCHFRSRLGHTGHTDIGHSYRLQYGLIAKSICVVCSLGIQTPDLCPYFLRLLPTESV